MSTVAAELASVESRAKPALSDDPATFPEGPFAIVSRGGWRLLRREQRHDAVVLDFTGTRARVASREPLERGEYVRLAVAHPADAPVSDIPKTFVALVLGEAPHIMGFPYAHEVAIVQTLRGRVYYLMDIATPWLAVLLGTLAIVNVVLLKQGNLSYFWYVPVMNLYGILVSIYIISRMLIAAFYRPPPDSDYRPTVSVVIACKDEEASIARTIKAVYDSDYNHDKIEVIAVDDGSTDNTLSEMRRTQEVFPKIKIISFATNRGKRHAMASGARVATGDIMIYVDSDSFLARNGIRKMVRGFADPEVGAVCGHAYVQNATKNLLTKMQEVRYHAAFRVVKAAESVFSAVTCCSGCFAAYRRSYVMEVLDDWLNQKFLGTEATFGDDRSLTNSLLRNYRILYDSEATCTTIVPEKMSVFFRQQARWKKSWIRESLRASCFMWKKHPMPAISFYLGVIFPFVAPIVVGHALVLPLFGLGNFSYLYIYGAMLMAALYGLVYLARHRSSMWIYGILFSLFYMLVLVWQTYYALVTVRRNHWGTR
jgi:hyaluronan synthase